MAGPRSRRYAAVGVVVALLAGGCSTFTWGINRSGQLGDGTTVDRETPAEITLPGLDALWTAVDAGGQHTCQIRSDTTMWCWGENQDGQLGDGTTVDRTTPTEVDGTGWHRVSAGHDYTCAIKTDLSLWCWGANTYDQIGDGGTAADRVLPAPVAVGTEWLDVAASTGRVTQGLGVVSEAHTCAIRTDQTLWCWGRNHRGQLGTGSTAPSATPTQVGSDTDWTEVAVGDTMSCARKADHSLWCWGMLIFDSFTTHVVPVRIGTDDDWTRISIGASWFVTFEIPGQEAAQFDHICGIKTDRSLWCWGANITGQLGHGAASPPGTPGSLIDEPTRVASAVDWLSVEAGPQGTCGIRASGPANTLWCWGEGDATPSEVDIGGDSAYQVAVGGIFYTHRAVITY